MLGKNSQTMAIPQTITRCGAGDTRGKTKPHRQGVGQRGTDHPCQRPARNGVEHHRFAAGPVGMLSREGKHLRVGGRSKALRNADEQQMK